MSPLTSSPCRMWKQTRSTAWSTIVNRATYWTLPLALAGAQEISQTWALDPKFDESETFMQRVTDSNHSASNCTSACPSQDSFSKFRPQADLTIAPTGSKATMIMTRISWHLLSCAAGYFSVKPSEEFWLNPGDFLGFSGTGIAGGIAYRSYFQEFQKYQKHFSN